MAAGNWTFTDAGHYIVVWSGTGSAGSVTDATVWKL